MHELHWHPNSDELRYYIEDRGRMTVYALGSEAQAFDYQGGDFGYLPKSMPHDIENTGTTKLRYLELWPSDHFEDVSLAHWLAFTTYELGRRISRSTGRLAWRASRQIKNQWCACKLTGHYI
jgi:oxalate decarboxylase